MSLVLCQYSGGKKILEIPKDLAFSVQMNSWVNLCDYFLAEPQRLCIWTVSSQMNEDFTLSSPYVFCFYHTGFVPDFIR